MSSTACAAVVNRVANVHNLRIAQAQERTDVDDPNAHQALDSLMSAGMLNSRDIDIIMLAAGYLSYELVDEYLKNRAAAERGERFAYPRCLPRLTVMEAAEEIVGRIGGCQFQDGGGTRLLSADGRRVHIAVHGTCVYCPQIRYTMNIIRKAIEFRQPEVEEIVIDGTRFEEKTEIPVNSQDTMAMLLKKTGLTYAEIDAALKARSTMTDDDLTALAYLKLATVTSVKDAIGSVPQSP